MNEKWVNAIHVLSNEIWENDTLLENSQITQYQIGLKMSDMIDILWFIMTQSVNLCRTKADNTQYTYDAKQKVSFSLFPSMFSYYWIVGQYILITVWCKSCYKSTVFAPVGKNTANMLKSRKFTRKIQKGGHWEQIWHVLKCKWMLFEIIECWAWLYFLYIRTAFRMPEMSVPLNLCGCIVEEGGDFLIL